MFIKVNHIIDNWYVTELLTISNSIALDLTTIKFTICFLNINSNALLAPNNGCVY